MWKIMKDNGVAITSTLVNELGMAHGNPPPSKLWIKVGLGVHSASINGGDIFTQMRVLTLQYNRARHHERIYRSRKALPAHNKFCLPPRYRRRR